MYMPSHDARGIARAPRVWSFMAVADYARNTLGFRYFAALDTADWRRCFCHERLASYEMASVTARATSLCYTWADWRDAQVESALGQP